MEITEWHVLSAKEQHLSILAKAAEASISLDARILNKIARVSAGNVVHVKYVSGTWTANPGTGMCDANGNSAYVAKQGYLYPGAYEGCLIIGQIIYPPLGDPQVLSWVANAERTVTMPYAGDLFFAINDDYFSQYGSGYGDNQGTITVEYSIS